MVIVEGGIILNPESKMAAITIFVLYMYVIPWAQTEVCNFPLFLALQLIITYSSNLDTYAQRSRGLIHALARAKDDQLRLKPEEQTVPGFSGFYANMSKPDEESRAIYHMTYSNPPSKTISLM